MRTSAVRTGRTLGKTLKGFQTASSEFEKEIQKALSETESTDEIKEVKTTSEDVQSEGGDMKMKKKVKPTFKKNTGENNVTKVDLSKPPKSEQQKVEEQVEQTKQEDDAIPIGETKEMDVEEQTGDSTKVDEQVQEPSEDAKTEENPIQEIKEEERIAKQILKDASCKLPAKTSTVSPLVNTPLVILISNNFGITSIPPVLSKKE